MKLIQNSFTTEAVLFQFHFNVRTVLMCSISLWSSAIFSWWEVWGPDGLQMIRTKYDLHKYAKHP